MAAKSHDKDDLNPWPELPEVLRGGVCGIRRAPAPQESLDRALNRAKRLQRPKPWLLRRSPLLVSTALAASLLILVLARYPFGSYIAGPNRDGGPSPQAHPDSARPVGAPPLVFTGPTIPRHGYQLANDPAALRAWADTGHAERERVWEMRHLAHGMAAADRAGIERYLRQLASRPEERTLVWHGNNRPLDQARASCAEGDLTLQGVSIEVQVEGPRARTVVDHVFQNPFDAPVEATFEYPLPDGANPSYFTLFPGNKTNVAPVPKLLPNVGSFGAAPFEPRVVPPAQVVRKIDPGCWGQPRVARVIPSLNNPPPTPADATASMPPGLDGPPGGPGAFRGKIGTILPRSKFRVLFAFEETLPLKDGKVTYTCPLPTCHLYDLKLALQVSASQDRDAVVTPSDAHREVQGTRVVYRRIWRGVTGAGTLSFQAPCPNPLVQATAGQYLDQYYLLARIRPEVPTVPNAAPFARHAVFLLDTSAGEQAARFDRSVKLIRAVLERDPDITRFNVLTFSTGTAWLEPTGWLPNTKEGRDRVVSRLDGIKLEGATDLSAALAALVKPPFPVPARTPMHCFLLSDGSLTVGDADVPRLLSRFEAACPWQTRWHCYQTGLGEENAELFALLTRAGGGVYLCPAEKDLPAAATAHQQPCLTVRKVWIESKGRARDLFVAGGRAAVYPGGELQVAARLSSPGPAQVVVTGTVGTIPIEQRFPVEVGADGSLAPRAWGELAVAALLASHDPKGELLGVPFARHFLVPTRLTSFALVEEDFGPPDPMPPTALYEFRFEADRAWADRGKPLSPYAQREAIRQQVDQWVQAKSHRQELRPIVDLLPNVELSLPKSTLAVAPSGRAPSNGPGVGERSPARKAPAAFFDEAERRSREGQKDAAARCLCGLIEEHPGSGELARQVGYQLVAIGHAALAARILDDLVTRSPTDAEAHRALAVALEEAGRPSRAALHYEVALAILGEQAGQHGAREELVALMHRTLFDTGLSPKLQSHYRIRLRELDEKRPAPLRVIATWNAPGADLEMLAAEVHGKVHRTPSPDQGGLSADRGLRRLDWTRPVEDVREVEVRLARPASIPGGTLVTIRIIRDAGTARERVETKRVLLRKQGDGAVVVSNKP